MLNSLNILSNLITWVHEDDPAPDTLPSAKKAETPEYPGFSAEDLQPLRCEETDTPVVDCEDSEALNIQVTSVSSLFERM